MSDDAPVYAVGSFRQPVVHGLDEPLPIGYTLPESESDLDAFLERMSELAGERPGGTGRSQGQSSAQRQAQDRRTQPAPKVDLVLYTSAASEKSQRALRTVRRVLKRYEASQVKFSTCDLSVRPQDAEADAVVFTPTLVKQGPGPRTAIIGNLEREDILCDLLDASGVDRRWDD